MKNSEIYFVVFLVAAVLLFNSCYGPIEGDDIIFVTQNTYKDLPPDAAQIILKTEKYNWGFDKVQYNDTVVTLSDGKFNRINHGPFENDPSFSYVSKQVDYKTKVTITGSFFSILTEMPRGVSSQNAPVVITVNISENKSKDKRMLLVSLMNTDNENYFLIEQNGQK